ncbi:MAG: hypothetical protein CFE38_20240 [Comamonadaceae bacterium PBBC1]|nr:MAG: hypothetical protein CFE38_20240 [Comamonadaceae bacterium PBBC1]
MDDLVKQAMVKWPEVPDCYGWLGLDARGHWWMRDERAQDSGSFQSGKPGSKGSILKHEKLIEFINRNYESDTQGCWFFQNGPQRVYVELEVTPYIWRLEEDGTPVAQTGQRSSETACLMDEQGRVYINTKLGFGLLHSLDVHMAAKAIEEDIWRIENCVAQELQCVYKYDISPQKTYLERSA